MIVVGGYRSGRQAGIEKKAGRAGIPRPSFGRADSFIDGRRKVDESWWVEGG